MLFRIVKNIQGNREFYNVQKRCLFIWSNCTYRQGLPSGCIGGCPDDYMEHSYSYEFDSIKEAEEFITTLTLQPEKIHTIIVKKIVIV